MRLPWILTTLAIVIPITALTAILPAQESGKPLNVLYVTGGGWHDYDKQAEIIPAGLEVRANIKVTVKKVAASQEAEQRHPAYAGENWAEGFDVVIHNVCNSANTDDAEWIAKVTQPHRDGVPAVVMHCSMHCYRPKRPNEWQKLLGVQSMNHESHHPITMTNAKPDHPIMKGFPATWTTPQGELYRILELGPNTTPLAKGTASEKKEHVCVWTSTYGKGRIFGTTIGHHNETVSEATYLDMLTRGVLWAADKLAEDGKPKAGYGK